MTTGKRPERTTLDFRCPICRSAIYWSSQLFDLRALSSTDVPVLLLNQSTIRKDLPVGRIHTCACAHTPCEQSFLSCMAFSVNQVVHVALCRVVGFTKQTNYATERVGRIHTCACAHTPCEQSFLSCMAFSVNQVVHVALCRVVGFTKQTNYATESHANDFVQDGNLCSLLTFII